MSRSKRKSPFGGNTTAVTEKQDKQIANRAERRINKQLIADNDSSSMLMSKREVSNVWSFGKDGKSRFDPFQYPKSMRK